MGKRVNIYFGERDQDLYNSLVKYKQRNKLSDYIRTLLRKQMERIEEIEPGSYENSQITISGEMYDLLIFNDITNMKKRDIFKFLLKKSGKSN